MLNLALELALNEEMRRLLVKEKVLSEATEILISEYQRLFAYCEANGIAMRDKAKVIQSFTNLKVVLEIFYESSPEVKHPDKSPDYEAEPRLGLGIERQMRIIRRSKVFYEQH